MQRRLATLAAIRLPVSIPEERIRDLIPSRLANAAIRNRGRILCLADLHAL